MPCVRSDSCRGDDAVDREALLKEFARGAALIFSNAEQLYSEAEILGKSGAFARCVFLHQISMEECAKVDMIGATATSILAGESFDHSRVVSAFRSHRAKNHANAYMAAATGEEKEARDRGDWDAALATFEQFKAQFHQQMNTTKNDALYVNYDGRRFSAPLVTEELACQYQALNGHFLQLASGYVRLLKRIETEEGAFEDWVKSFREMAESLRKSMPDDPMAAMDLLLAEMGKVFHALHPNHPEDSK